ncbi:MAG: HdeD family acid-resistance protein [Microbacterium gubbeenense]|uniref:HdeD family acid-resistance protein n=1 Tax=Microbacterium gubbeenense TaxID=159896 RepID=UPI003F9B9AB7
MNTTPAASEFGTLKTLRTVILASGIMSLIFGIVVLVWPVKSAMAVTIVIAVYAILAGLMSLVNGIRSKGVGGWTRAGLVVLGLVFLAAGVVAFGNLGESTLLLAVFVTTFIGAAWIIDGVVSLFSLGVKDRALPGATKAHKGWSIFYGIISVLAGVFVVISPLMSALWLWIFLGASLVVMGIIGIVRGASLDA